MGAMQTIKRQRGGKPTRLAASSHGAIIMSITGLFHSLLAAYACAASAHCPRDAFEHPH